MMKLELNINLKLYLFLFHIVYIAMQILPEVLHLCLSTGGIKHPLHSAVIPQYPQRRFG